eukprot:14407574-Alexandrium_andersonii.AAC.1
MSGCALAEATRVRGRVPLRLPEPEGLEASTVDLFAEDVGAADALRDMGGARVFLARARPL